MDLNRRRKKYINSKLQNKIISYSLLNSIIFLFLFYFSQNWVLGKVLDSVSNLQPTGPGVDMIFVQLQHRFSIIFVALSGVVLTIGAVFGVIFTNKIAGPLYRMKTHLKECADEKKLKEVTFREGDLLTDLQDDFNDLVKAINEES